MLWIFYWNFPVHERFGRPLIPGKIIAASANVSVFSFSSVMTMIPFIVIPRFRKNSSLGYLETHNESTNSSEDLRFRERLEVQNDWSTDRANVKCQWRRGANEVKTALLIDSEFYFLPLGRPRDSKYHWVHIECEKTPVEKMLPAVRAV